MKLQKLRFLDLSDPNKHIFITAFVDGDKRGYFKRESKDAVTSSAEGTTCRIQKRLLTEARILSEGWHQLERQEFTALLSKFNAIRSAKGWEPVELPPLEEEDGD